MTPAKCQKCGKEFDTEHALKIHVGRMHGAKKRAAKGHRCKICGRSFQLPMHLGRHMVMTHGKRAKVGKTGQVRRVGRPVGRPPAAAAPRGLNVPALSIDQLLGLKQAVDARLVSIARQMRQARLRV